MGILQLSLSAGKFVDCSPHTLDSYLQSQPLQRAPSKIGVLQTDEQPPPRKRACLEHYFSDTKNTSVHPSTCEDTCSAETHDYDWTESKKDVSEMAYPDDVLEECEECGEKVPVWLVDCHKDHHFAVKLSQDPSLPVTTLHRHERTLDSFFHRI